MRYYSTGAWIKREEQTRENTIEEHDEAIPWDSLQKHFDEFSEKVLPGEKFPSRAVDCDAYQRRRPCSGLGFSRVPFLEPLGLGDLFYKDTCHRSFGIQGRVNI